MRYQVRFEPETGDWTVIDSKVGGRILQRHADREDAKQAAWYEEERWYKCTPPDAMAGGAGTALGTS